MLSLLKLPFSKSLALMSSLTGEVHTGGDGKPGAGQKIFCPGTEIKQPEHEGLVWPVHGEYCLALKKSNTRREGKGGRGKNSRTILATLRFVKVKVGHSGS